jgi:hypothetical protein
MTRDETLELFNKCNAVRAKVAAAGAKLVSTKLTKRRELFGMLGLQASWQHAEKSK